MHIVYFVIAAVGFASCTPTQAVVIRQEFPRSVNYKPKQPAYDRLKGEVKVISMTYYHIDTLPLIDKPRKHKKHTVLEESIHVYEEPRLTDSLDRHLHYPEILARQNIQGTVVIDLLIDKTGKVIKAAIMSADNSALGRSAIDDLYRYARFIPIIIDNRPERARCVIMVEYKLSKS